MSIVIPKEEYASFYEGYVSKSTGVALIPSLEEGSIKLRAFFKEFPHEKLEFRYETGKWTPKEILLHLIDSERVFAYRALLFARSAHSEIKGFDQDEFVENSAANDRNLPSLLEEYEHVRKATICLFSAFSEKDLIKRGKANNSMVSVRALGKIISGHEIHHLEILKERYF